MASFTDLIVWQKSHKLTLEIYKLTETLPASEQFGLVSQMRRAAVSIPSNIVEGYERGTDKEMARYLIIARGSLAELQSQLLICRDLGMISKENFSVLAEKSVEVNKLINGYRKGMARTSRSRAS